MTMTRVGHATGMRWWGCGVVWCGDFLLWRLPYGDGSREHVQVR
eukprot:COSAG02_NODE_15466_length_1168_cov_1.948550_1_plen_43_part_10